MVAAVRVVGRMVEFLVTFVVFGCLSCPIFSRRWCCSARTVASACCSTRKRLCRWPVSEEFALGFQNAGDI